MILFVDDEPRTIDAHRLYLEDMLKEKGKELRYFEDVNDAKVYFDENSSSIELAILDIMMPSNGYTSLEKSGDGMKTGYLFYQEIRETLSKLPILIFTHSLDDQIQAKIEEDENAQFLQKDEHLIDDLWEKVEEVLLNGES